MGEHSHSKSASCLRGNSTRETPSMMKVLLLMGLACLLVACQARPASEDELRKLMKEVIEDELKEELLAELEELEGQDDKRLPKDGSKPLAQERRKSGKMTSRRMIASHAPLKTTNHFPRGR